MKKRHYSETEDNIEDLSLTEYLARKMKEGEDPQTKRVRGANLTFFVYWLFK